MALDALWRELIIKNMKRRKMRTCGEIWKMRERVTHSTPAICNKSWIEATINNAVILVILAIDNAAILVIHINGPLWLRDLLWWNGTWTGHLGICHFCHPTIAHLGTFNNLWKGMPQPFDILKHLAFALDTLLLQFIEIPTACRSWVSVDLTV